MDNYTATWHTKVSRYYLEFLECREIKCMRKQWIPGPFPDFSNGPWYEANTGGIIMLSCWINQQVWTILREGYVNVKWILYSSSTSGAKKHAWIQEFLQLRGLIVYRFIPDQTKHLQYCRWPLFRGVYQVSLISHCTCRNLWTCLKITAFMCCKAHFAYICYLVLVYMWSLHNSK